MFVPHPVSANARFVAGAGFGAGFLFGSHPLKRKNCVVDLVQLLLKMGNQCREVNLVQQGVTPGISDCTLPSKARKVDTVEPAIRMGRYPRALRVTRKRAKLEIG